MTQGFDLQPGASPRRPTRTTRCHGGAAWRSICSSRTPERWFLYANVNDPQAPYEPPRELLGELTDARGRPAAAPDPHLGGAGVHGQARALARAELRYVRRLYRGELQVVDQALSSTCSSALRDGERRIDDAIVVLVGDARRGVLRARQRGARPQPLRAQHPGAADDPGAEAAGARQGHRAGGPTRSGAHPRRSGGRPGARRLAGGEPGARDRRSPASAAPGGLVSRRRQPGRHPRPAVGAPSRRRSSRRNRRSSPGSPSACSARARGSMSRTA